jgi:hypothetical protein
MLSAAIRNNEILRERISRIGKVKLASIPQQLQMAHVCGLWSEVMKIGQAFNHTQERI